MVPCKYSDDWPLPILREAQCLNLSDDNVHILILAYIHTYIYVGGRPHMALLTTLNKKMAHPFKGSLKVTG